MLTQVQYWMMGLYELMWVWARRETTVNRLAYRSASSSPAAADAYNTVVLRGHLDHSLHDLDYLKDTVSYATFDVCRWA